MTPDGPLPSEPHPSPERLARLIDSDDADRGLVEHLATCPRCMGIYAEFVQTRAHHLAATPQSAVPQAPGGTAAVLPPITPPAPARFRSFWTRVPGITAAALAASLLLVALSVRLESSTTGRMRGVIGAQMRHDAVGGLIYAPTLTPTPRGVRGTAIDRRVSESVTAMTRRYDPGKASPDDTFWLIGGFLATDALDNADAYLRVALARQPEDARLHNLAAILAYKRNDLAGAAQELERSVAAEPTPEALYNLARVRDAAGDSGLAESTRQRLRRTHSNSPIVTWMGETGD